MRSPAADAGLGVGQMVNHGDISVSRCETAERGIRAGLALTSAQGARAITVGERLYLSADGLTDSPAMADCLGLPPLRC